jgi:hypothetical protein
VNFNCLIKKCQMYTSTIEQEWAVEHCDGGSWYMDMPKGTIHMKRFLFTKSVVLIDK